MEKQRHINSILRQSQGDPLILEKGYPTKQYCYETIELIVSLGNIYEFEKIPKKSYEIENSDFNHLDLPINHMMFVSAQYQLVDKFDDKEEYKKLKLRLHTVLGKKEEEVWSLVKIVKVLNISKDALFEGLLQNFQYYVVRANNVACDFSMVDFPLMNLNDLSNVAKILSDIDVSKLQMTSKRRFFDWVRTYQVVHR